MYSSIVLNAYDFKLVQTSRNENSEQAFFIHMSNGFINACIKPCIYDAVD